jgi:hypothetical protein
VRKVDSIYLKRELGNRDNCLRYNESGSEKIKSLRKEDDNDSYLRNLKR